jgi:hypothetical protein
MRILAVVGGVVLVIGLVIVLAYRLFLPRAFVAAGRGSIREVGAVTVARVAVIERYY